MTQWWKHTVFYQVYPRSFCDSNGDGIGDIPGITSKLDYLQELGIGALWLSPVYRSPNHDNGYDISDYYDINPEYGTLDDMKRLIAEARERGIRVIMDLVINHTSDEHPWFIAAKDPQSPYHDYYIWKKPLLSTRGSHTPPNNWLSYFGGSAWQWHDASGQYYLHLFSVHQPDLNYNNPKVIDEVKEIMRYWLDMGVAGFRCDVINMIYKSSFTNGHYSFYHLPGSHHYFSQEGNHEILRQLRRDVLQPYGAFTVGETAGGIDPATAKRFATDELDTVFTFEHMTIDEWGMPFAPRPYRPARLRRALMKWQEALDWNTLFFENHDTKRSLDKFHIDHRYKIPGATMLATLLLTLRGVPFIFQGEEIGMENYPFISIDQVQDVGVHGIYDTLRRFHLPKRISYLFAMMVCRDYARTPMQWDTSVSAGFSVGRQTWQPIHPNYTETNVAAERGNPQSIHNFYRQLIAFRLANDAFQTGECIFLPSARNVLAFRREQDGKSYEVIVNLSARPQKSVVWSGEYVLGNYPEPAGHAQTLRPYEVVILEKQKPAK